MSRALLLSGGTAMGAVQVHTIEQLCARMSFEFVAGVSAGANNGVAVAQGTPGRLRPLWESLQGTRSFMTINYLGIRRGIMDLDPLRRIVAGELPRHDWVTEYHVGVADYQDDRYRSIRVDTLPTYADMEDAIIASSSQPVYMQWVEVKINGRRHVCFDGGVFHVLPQIPQIRQRGITEVHAVFANPIRRKNRKRKKRVDDLLEIAGRTAAIYMDGVIRRDVERLKRWARQGIEVWLYAPLDAGEPFDASAETIRWRLEEVGPRMYANRVRL